jgi:hypothetical protein
MLLLLEGKMDEAWKKKKNAFLFQKSESV